VKTRGAPSSLVELASAPYRHTDRFAYYHARGKLRADPAFTAIVQRGLLAGRTQVLDLGCGQGLLHAWLHAANALHRRGDWIEGWPAPPQPALRGIDLATRDIERARHALGGDFAVDDIRTADYGNADAIVILDVLHYIPHDAQVAVLRRARATLPDNGLLLTRVGDADAGLPFRFSRWFDKVVMAARGRGFGPLYCRALREWLALLVDCGFETDTLPMQSGTPFANVMLLAYAR
jgi:SAM-dependent methyltransferase